MKGWSLDGTRIVLSEDEIDHLEDFLQLQEMNYSLFYRRIEK